MTDIRIFKVNYLKIKYFKLFKQLIVSALPKPIKAMFELRVPLGDEIK